MAKKALAISLLVCASAAQTNEMHQDHPIPALSSSKVPVKALPQPYFGEEDEKNKEVRSKVPPMVVQKQMAQSLGATLIHKKALAQEPRVLGNQHKLQLIDKSMTFFVDAKLSSEPWAVYRPIATFKRSMAEKNIEMVSLEYVAMASVVQHDGKITQMALQSQYQEVRPNDILLRPYLLKKYTLRSANASKPCAVGAVEGQINGRRYAGLDDLVVVNLGLRDGIRQGASLTAVAKPVDVQGERATQFSDAAQDGVNYQYKKLQQNTTYTLPKQALGELNIVQVFPYFSLAKVQTARQPIAAGSAVETCRE
ncbi:MAG: hypothetical protein ACRC9T_04815 [Vibrionaceae bacterium]